jgi:membrane fusion protein (multidrug efflux system)
MQPKLLSAAFFFLLCTAACKNKTETKVESRTTTDQKGGAKGKDQPPTVVDVIVAGTQVISNTVEVNGTVVAGESVEVHPEISGRLTYLNVPEGSRIGRGTTLARINDADIQAQLRKLRVQLDLAQKTEERFKKLIAVNGLNQSDYDAALNQVNSLKADIGILSAQLDKTIVRAPFSGVVGLRAISPGAYVTPASVIATIQQVDRVKIDFTIPQEYSAFVKRGTNVVVDLGTGQKYRATVVAEDPQASAATRSIKLRAQLTNGISNPGAFAKVYLDATGASGNAIMVPTNAIIPEAKAKKLVLVKEGKAKFVNVETGSRRENNIEILGGVAAGDTIVVSGVLFARPGNAVKIGKVKTLEQLAAQQSQ